MLDLVGRLAWRLFLIDTRGERMFMVADAQNAARDAWRASLLRSNDLPEALGKALNTSVKSDEMETVGS